MFTPQGKKIVFKSDTGVCERIRYIDLHANKVGMAILETIRENFRFHTKKSLDVQSIIGYPSSEQHSKLGKLLILPRQF